MVRTLVMGAVIGLVCGLLFGVLYFGAGQITTPMAYIHDISGTGLGILIAAIVYLYKRGSAPK
jgi:hypothetical protein